MLVTFWIDVGEEKTKWGTCCFCFFFREGRVSFPETTNSSVGHHKLSNALEESLYQGTVIEEHMHIYLCEI